MKLQETVNKGIKWVREDSLLFTWIVRGYFRACLYLIAWGIFQDKFI